MRHRSERYFKRSYRMSNWRYIASGALVFMGCHTTWSFGDSVRRGLSGWCFLFSVAKLVDIIPCSSGSWQWIFVIPLLFGLSRKCSTPDKERTCKVTLSPFHILFHTFFLMFFNSPTVASTSRLSTSFGVNKAGLPHGSVWDLLHFTSLVATPIGSWGCRPVRPAALEQSHAQSWPAMIEVTFEY